MGPSSFGFDVNAVGEFVEPCMQSLALVQGAKDSCEEDLGRGGGGSLQSWVDDVNYACCMQEGINVCRDGDTVPWICMRPAP